MKKLLLALGIAALLCSPALAGRNAGGAMVLHTNDAVNYSAGTDYCSVDPLPNTCEEFVTQINKDPGIEAMIWMVAAFPQGSSPGVTAFQVGITGNDDPGNFSAYAPCGPGALEIPDATWPAPGTGTAVAFQSPVFSQLFKIYWFAAGAGGPGTVLGTGAYPNGDHNAEWADDSNPAQIDVCNLFGRVVWGGPGANECPQISHIGACCFPDGHCEVLDQTACGGVYQGDGTTCPPNPPCPPPVGACCLNGVCIGNFIETECTAQGGTWEGFGSDCATFQCPPPEPTGACCINQVCSIQTQANCVAQGGEYKGDNVPCNPDTCVPPPPTGACCIAQVCSIMTQADCLAAGGEYKGDNVPCNADTCIPVPTKSTTWGQIKGQYR